MKKHNIDVMLASTAIVENATIVSADGLYSTLSTFNSNLKVENWSV